MATMYRVKATAGEPLNIFGLGDHMIDQWHDLDASDETAEVVEYAIEDEVAGWFERELDGSQAVIEWEKVGHENDEDLPTGG